MQNSKSLFCFGKKGNSWDFEHICNTFEIQIIVLFVSTSLSLVIIFLVVYTKKVNIAFYHALLLGENRALNYQF